MGDSAAFNKAAEKIGRFLPAGAYTGFQYIAAQITTDGSCDQTQRDFFIIFMGILAATSTILAVTQRLRGRVEDSRSIIALLCLFRAVGSTAIFLSLAILTPPGPTCLFTNPDPTAKEKSIIPRYTNACVCTTLVVVFSTLTHYFNFVTDDKEAASTDEEKPEPPPVAGEGAEVHRAGAVHDAVDHNGIDQHQDTPVHSGMQPEAGPSDSTAELKQALLDKRKDNAEDG
ncbi:g1130 [Coccomyxa elongata]